LFPTARPLELSNSAQSSRLAESLVSWHSKGVAFPAAPSTPRTEYSA
jgi:hypothetical protein